MGHLDVITKFGTPLINSATPWATTLEQLANLYDCPYTSAVTVRTSVLNGFAHKDDIHQYTFFDTASLDTKTTVAAAAGAGANSRGSLNTLGYSPIPLRQTLSNISRIVAERGLHVRNGQAKSWIISVTGSPADVLECINVIGTWHAQSRDELGNTGVFIEINLSCPNISGVPPPAFHLDGLEAYLQCIADADKSHGVVIGIKLPPYSNPENFAIVKNAIAKYATWPESVDGLALRLGFITSTNTLGCSLLLDSDFNAKLNSADGSGLGGLAGAPLHPLALGNVLLLRKMLDSIVALSQIELIGIGGVSDNGGFSRMLVAGAVVVGVGTAYGIGGVGVFERIGRPAKLHADHHGPEYVT